VANNWVKCDQTQLPSRNVSSTKKDDTTQLISELQ